MAGNGVAVIVVHGVADQKPGETARAVVELLVATDPGHVGAAYEAISREDFVIAAPPLAPKGAPPERHNATPRGEDRGLGKSWLQSKGSDFQRHGWQVAGDAAAAPIADAPALRTDADRGIAATDYLLTKHRDNGAANESYESACIHLERRAETTTPVDVYEMYWADQSRLSGALPRIVTELFTMVFRLSKLGRDTVDEAARAGNAATPRSTWSARGWRLTAFLQSGLDWMFANVLALLFAQLLLLGLVFVALGLAALAANRHGLYAGLAGAGLAGGALAFFYHRRDALTGPGRWAPGFLVAFACIGALVSAPLAPWVLALLLIAIVTLLYDAALRVADDRFPLVRMAGRAMWAALLALMLASAVHEFARAESGLDPLSFDVGWHAALFGVELTLWSLKVWWMVAGGLLAVWFLAGIVAAWRRGYEDRASIATGRLGLAISIATFLVLTMAIWALLSSVIDRAAANVVYSPCIFAFDEAAAIRTEEGRRVGRGTVDDSPRGIRAPPPYAATPNECLWRTEAGVVNAIVPAAPSPSASSGARFLNDRYVNSTAAFSVVATLLIGLVAYLVAVFLPSVLAEMKLLVGRARELAKKTVEHNERKAQLPPPPPWIAAPKPRPVDAGERDRVRRLGRWLTAGFRHTDAVVLVVVGVGAAAGLGVALLFSVDYVTDLLGAARPGGFVRGLLLALEERVREASADLLKPFVLATAGIGVALTALGGVLSRYLPPLRAPLDIALDVDNHFREFPRAAIPRARIFSRYAALLGHVAARDYARIVVVAHSQGTVISAELLRFLASRDAHAPGPNDAPRLDGVALPEIRMLTLGCPLRQLYAARFPTLYRWVIERRAATTGMADLAGAITGPRAHDIGVARWVNAFCAGDYVGRWLWSDSPAPADNTDPVGHPMIDNADRATRFGREFAYDGFDPMPPVVAPFQSDRELEVCLGFGAHTHYFEPDQADVAWLIDTLVR